MTKNPFINALAAALYIAVIVSAIFNAPKSIDSVPVIMPIAMLSLFTLSAGFMGYCFLYQPLRLYLDGDKKKGANLFLHTLAVFAGITILFLVIALISTSR